VTRHSATVLGRYFLFQIPGMFVAGLTLTLLVRWTPLTPELAAGLFGLWVLKDLVMFPVTRIAYEPRSRPHGADAMLGARGVAQQELEPGETGYVRVGAELWKARLSGGSPRCRKADTVQVLEVHDLTLLVERTEP
jgi:membrane protein implicated in regulation of membrane protease activity